MEYSRRSESDTDLNEEALMQMIMETLMLIGPLPVAIAALTAGMFLPKIVPIVITALGVCFIAYLRLIAEGDWSGQGESATPFFALVTVVVMIFVWVVPVGRWMGRSIRDSR